MREQAMLKAMIGLAGAVLLSGCAHAPDPPSVKWTKPKATQADYAQDRYRCLQESQQRRYLGIYVDTNYVLFDACMNAHGYQAVMADQPLASNIVSH
jgi:starvation-inducible outer membrane lipoprotein